MNPACVHHFVIETPHGPTSPGVCRHCGEARIFSNAPADEHAFGAGATRAKKGGGRGIILEPNLYDFGRNNE